MAYTRIQFDEMFEKLPNDIQEALDSDTMIDFLKEIEKKYSLERDQTKELSAEIGVLMLGASSPQVFIPNIQESMGVSEDVAKAIASEVNERIFRPVKESLKTIYSLNKKEEPKKINILPFSPNKTESETKPVSIEGSDVANKEELIVSIADPYREAI